MKKIVGSIMIILSSFIACKREDENPLRDPGRFAGIYAATLMATRATLPATAGEKTDGALRRARVDSVLAAHQINRAQLADAVSYFSEDPQRWREVYRSVIQELDSLSRHSTRRPPSHLPKQ